MKLFSSALLAALFWAAVPLHSAQRAAFFDYVRLGDPGYALLRRAALQSGLDDWMAERLKAGQPLPQASARDFVQEVLELPAVEAGLKEDLKKTFPPETALAARTFELYAESEDLKRRIAELQPRLAEILTAKDRNNYSALSAPKGELQVTSYLLTGEYRGLTRSSQFARIEPVMYGNHIQFTLSGVVGNASWSFITGFCLPYTNSAYLYNPGYWNLFPNAYYPGSPLYQPKPVLNTDTFNSLYFFGQPSLLKLNFDPPWFPGMSLTIGSVYVNTGVDELLFSSPAIPFYNPFLGNTTMPDLSEVVHQDGKGVTGFVLQKAGKAGWWPFTNAVVYYQPSLFNTGDLLFARGDIRSLDLWFIEDSNIWLGALVEGNPDYSSKPWMPSIDTHAYSAGLKGQLFGSGLMSVEYATSNWYCQALPTAPIGNQLDLDWKDNALMVSVSKSFAEFSFALQGASIGPYFVTNSRGGLASDISQGMNGQAGNLIDSTVYDPRPGNKGLTTWQTICSGFDWNNNNSQRLNLSANWTSFFTTFGVSAGYNTQLQPSGPWIGTTRWLNNRPKYNIYNNMDYDWYAIMGGNYKYMGPGYVVSPLDMPGAYNLVAYNAATSHPALYHGVPLGLDPTGAGLPASGNCNWQDLQSLGFQTTTETLLLSQNGLGDANLREDSIKTVNDLKVSLKLDFRALLHTDYPLQLEGYSEIRDVDEAMHLARYTPDDLLSQFIHEYFITWGLNDTFNLLGCAGYETWASNAGYFPLSTVDDSFGVGMDIMLSKLLTGLTINARYKWMDHQDLNYSQRNFFGFTSFVGTTIVY